MRTKIGVFGTLLWIGFVSWWAIVNKAHLLPLNELGDYIAGAIAPLAFFWFILAYLLQKEELAKNTKALEEQQNELKNQYKAMDSQAKALKKAATSLQEYSRPYLSAHFELIGEKEFIFLVVQNFGIRPAYNVKFKFDPPLSEFSRYPKMSYEDFISLNFIPPNYKQEYYINSRPGLINEKEEIRWETNVEVTYQDSTGEKYSEVYSLEFYEAKDKVYTKVPAVEESLNDVSDHLSSISNDLLRISSKLSNDKSNAH